jgi:hypothetical protein
MHLNRPAQTTGIARDSITIPRSELKHLLRAVVLVDDDQHQVLLRYESDTGSLAFECPTGDACNLDVPARTRASATQTIARTVIENGRPATESVTYEPTVTEISTSSEVADQVVAVSAKAVRAPKQSVYERLGVRNGDTIVSIDGQAVNSPDEAFRALANLKSDAPHRVVVRREGKEVQLRAE